MAPNTKVSEITVKELRELIVEVSTEVSTVVSRKVFREEFPVLLDHAMQHIYLPAIEAMMTEKLEPIQLELRGVKDRLDIIDVRQNGTNDQLATVEKRLHRVEDLVDMNARKIDTHLLHHEKLDARVSFLEQEHKRSSLLSDRAKEKYGDKEDATSR